MRAWGDGRGGGGRGGAGEGRAARGQGRTRALLEGLSSLHPRDQGASRRRRVLNCNALTTPERKERERREREEDYTLSPPAGQILVFFR